MHVCTCFAEGSWQFAGLRLFNTSLGVVLGLVTVLAVMALLEFWYEYRVTVSPFLLDLDHNCYY